MGNKEISRKTWDEKIGAMTRKWVNKRFGVDETPVVDKKTTRKTPEVILFDPNAIEAGWVYNRFGVDER